MLDITGCSQGQVYRAVLVEIVLFGCAEVFQLFDAEYEPLMTYRWLAWFVR